MEFMSEPTILGISSKPKVKNNFPRLRDRDCLLKEIIRNNKMDKKCMKV